VVVELRQDKHKHPYKYSLTIEWGLQNFSPSFPLKKKKKFLHVTVRQNGSKHFLLTMIEIHRA